VLRGGGFLSNWFEVRVAYRYGRSPVGIIYFSSIGFRCAGDPPAP